MCPRPTASSHWPPPYAPIPWASQCSYAANSRSIEPNLDGLTLTVRGGQRSASMSATEWIDRVPGDAIGVRLEQRLRLGGECGILDPGVGEGLDHPPVEVGVGWVVDHGAGVLPLEVDRVDACERLELVEDLVRPVRPGVELEPQAGIEGEERAEPRGRGRVAEPARGHEGHGPRLPPDGLAERSSGLAEGEVERGALERPAPVVDVHVALGRAARRAAASRDGARASRSSTRPPAGARGRAPAGPPAPRRRR